MYGMYQMGHVCMYVCGSWLVEAECSLHGMSGMHVVLLHHYKANNISTCCMLHGHAAPLLMYAGHPARVIPQVK